MIRADSSAFQQTKVHLCTPVTGNGRVRTEEKHGNDPSFVKGTKLQHELVHENVSRVFNKQKYIGHEFKKQICTCTIL